MIAKFITLLIAGILCFVAVTANAELFMSWETGTIGEFNKYQESDPGNAWTTLAECLEEIPLGSEGKSYFHFRLTDESPGQVEDIFIRSTEDTVYQWNGAEEVLIWQTGPVGTTWQYVLDATKPTEITFAEITQNSVSVTVPYGGPFNAYCYRKSLPSNPNPNAIWDEYIVPGLGMVKIVDYWASDPPTIQELVRTRTVPEPSALVLLGMGAVGLFMCALRRCH